MFNEDNLAAAQIAQIFGSELLKVQNSARTDGGTTPQIVNLDPKQFLMGQRQYQTNQKEEEIRITQALQREAEAAYPISQSEPYNPQVAPATLPPQLISPPIGGGGATNPSPQLIAPFPIQQTNILERIAISLEQIASAVNKVELKSKKKIVKRTKTKLNKSTLLNETHA